MPRGKRASTAVSAASSQRPQKKARRGRPPARLASMSSAEVDASSVAGANEVGNAGDAESDDTGATATTEGASTALKHLEALMQRTDKKDNFAKKFEKMVREEERRLLHLLDEDNKQRKAEANKFRSRVGSLITMSLGPPGIKRPAAQDGQIKAELSPESHPLYVRSQSLLKNCSALVNEWNKLVEYTASVEEPPALREVWERDYAEAHRIIALGREASENDVKRLLMHDGRSSKKVSKETMKKQKEFEEDVHLQEMLKMGRDDAHGEMQEQKEMRGWGVVAHRTERGLQALAAALPDERS